LECDKCDVVLLLPIASNEAMQRGQAIADKMAPAFAASYDVLESRKSEHFSVSIVRLDETIARKQRGQGRYRRPSPRRLRPVMRQVADLSREAR
jgi:hypothetical protein